MDETSADRAQLRQLLTQSIEQAGSFLRESFQMPDHSLSAGQLIHHLQGLQTVALATATSRGEPRVAPIGALFYRGAFYIPSVAEAARTRQIKKQPAVSLTQFDGVDFALIIHGEAKILDGNHPDFAHLDGLHKTLSGSSVQDWGEGVYIQVQANRFFTFARYPDKFPEQAQPAS